MLYKVVRKATFAHGTLPAYFLPNLHFYALFKQSGMICHRLISTIHAAGVALAVTIPGFENVMTKSKAKGLTFAVVKGQNSRS